MQLDPTVLEIIQIVIIGGAIATALMLGFAGLTVAERKLLGRFTMRYGPNRVGKFGSLQIIADMLKMFFKEELVPGHVNRLVYVLAPIFALVPALIAFAVVPLAGQSYTLPFEVFGNTIIIDPWIAADINVGVLYLLAIGSLMEQGWASPNHLWSVDPETGTTRPVETGVDRSMGDAINCDVRFPGRQHEPWISSDGRRALVRVTDRAAVRLAEINLESGALSWSSPEDVSVLAFHSTPDGASRVELRTSMTELPELWVAAGDAPLRRLTKLNDRLLAQRQVFPGLPANVTASDGAQVEAWIQGAAQGKRPKRPLILAIHGGPKTVYGHAFMLEFQMLAGSGFAVLTSNPRGSDGYGTDWAVAVHAHYGERDYQDLMEVVDHALEADLGVDPQRLGVSGGSYGGFMTNWIVGHTDRFHAAVSQRGISNWESFFGTSDIGYFFSPEHIGALPWEDPGRYREKSPLTYAERIRTPLLIIHSEKDLRCPIEQAEQLFVYLKRLERDVRLARFPDESHELSRSGSPKRRMERLRLILSWFEERLAPGSRPG